MGSFQSKKKYDVATGESTIKKENPLARNDRKREYLSRISQQILDTQNTTEVKNVNGEQFKNGELHHISEKKDDVSAIQNEDITQADALETDHVITDSATEIFSTNRDENPNGLEKSENVREEFTDIQLDHLENHESPTSTCTTEPPQEVKAIENAENATEAVESYQRIKDDFSEVFINEERKAVLDCIALPNENIKDDESVKCDEAITVLNEVLNEAVSFSNVGNVQEDQVELVSVIQEGSTSDEATANEVFNVTGVSSNAGNVQEDQVELTSVIKEPFTGDKAVTVLNEVITKAGTSSTIQQDHVDSVSQEASTSDEAIAALKEGDSSNVCNIQEDREESAPAIQESSTVVEPTRKRGMIGEAPTQEEISEAAREPVITEKLIDEKVAHSEEVISDKESHLEVNKISIVNEPQPPNKIEQKIVSHIYLESVNGDDVHYTLDKLQIMEEQIHTSRARIMSIKEIN